MRFFNSPNSQPFDKTKHEATLARGRYTMHPSNGAIFIDSIQANIQGDGFGTAVMREAVKESLKKNDGSVRVDASWSSHLFYLYMGMKPIESHINFVRHIYGRTAVRALDELDKGVELSHATKFHLIDILQYEKGDQCCKNPLKERDFLLSLRDRPPLSYIENEFVPMLCQSLKNQRGKKYPDTSQIGSCIMILSEEGKERWQAAISGNTEFTPFKNFEHLPEASRKVLIQARNKVTPGSSTAGTASNLSMR